MTTTAPTVAERPASWAVIGGQELRELWLGSKGVAVLFAYSVILASMSYLSASDAGINLLDARESVGIVVQTAIGLGTLAALVVSADAISGERERGTLEALLVTPINRRDLVLGKLLAATTMWVAALLLALPFVIVMAQGVEVAGDAVVVLLVAGSLVAAALTGLGLAISAISMSNRTSLAAAIATLVMLAAPSQLPAITTKSVIGSILIKANPVSSGLTLAKRILVDQRTWSSQWSFLVSPFIAAVLLTVVAIFLSRRVQLGDAR